MRRLLGFVLVVLLLAACSGGADDGAQAGAAPAADAGAPVQAAEGAPLDFTAATVDGGQIDASSLEGRDVVLWFWAPW